MNDGLYRLGIFIAILLAMSVWEWVWPKRKQLFSKPLRWTNNLALGLLNSALIVLSKISAVGAAAYFQAQQIGILHGLSVPFLAKCVIAFLLLDLLIYAQHVVFHKWGPLWRLHRVHHSDPEIDVSTALRFHSVEVLLSMGIKIAGIAIIGAAPIAVFVFEIVLNGAAMFNHSNVRMPNWLDRSLRVLLVTPDMHRVHHSTDGTEMNRNFGFNLPWWDKLCRTYQDQPKDGHQNMTIGLGQLRQSTDQRLLNLLAQPIKKR